MDTTISNSASSSARRCQFTLGGLIGLIILGIILIGLAEAMNAIEAFIGSAA